eukprot:6212448-Amphidinium_carterae.1
MQRTHEAMSGTTLIHRLTAEGMELVEKLLSTQGPSKSASSTPVISFLNLSRHCGDVQSKTHVVQ